MSATPEDGPHGAGPEPAPASRKHEKEPAQARPKRRWWWRWTRRLVLTAVVARLLLWLFLQPLADFGAGFAGLSIAWRDASLSLTGLSLHIQDLVVRDRADAEAPPLLTAHDVILDVAAGKLLGGDVEIVDASLAGARITVHQNADGTLRLPATWIEPATGGPADEAAPTDDGPLSFALPVAIASVRLHDVRLQFVDHRSQPATVHEGTLDFDVHDVGYQDRPGAVMLRVHVPALCDELYVTANVRTDDTTAEAEVTAAVRQMAEDVTRLSRRAETLLDSSDEELRTTAQALRAAADSLGAAARRLSDPGSALFGPPEGALGPGERAR